MKIRNSFITNSSSSSFLITNISDEPKTLKDFFKEIKDDIEKEWVESISGYTYGLEFHQQYPTFDDFYNKVLQDSDNLYDKIIDPNQSIKKECGDHPSEDGYAEYFIHMHTWLESNYQTFEITELENHH